MADSEFQSIEEAEVVIPESLTSAISTDIEQDISTSEPELLSSLSSHSQTQGFETINEGFEEPVVNIRISQQRSDTSVSNSSAPGNDTVEQPLPGNTQQQQPRPTVGSDTHNRPRNRRLTIRDRHGVFMNYLFLNLTIRYATYFKSTARRLIEFFSLLNALLMFLVLLYIHVIFVRSSGDCLNHVRDVWPHNGILRVQISYNQSSPSYQLLFAKNDIPSSISFQSTPYDVQFKFSSPIFPEDVHNYKLWRDIVLNQSREPVAVMNDEKQVCENVNTLNKHLALHLLNRKCPIAKQDYKTALKQTLSATLTSIMSDMSVDYRAKKLPEDSLITFITGAFEYDLFEPSPVREHYAIEYSKEFGYLRLSTKARFKLGVPTLVVNLNPDVDDCFGSGVKNFMLKTFLGYDDFLMSSIKKLAENDKSQGYLRNIITGEYFRFVTVWVNHTSSILAFLVMVLFTLIVSMLLRYSYQQIFMFMMEVLRLLDTDVRLAFPAAPMLTIVLALVGMEEIMTEFFHDSTVAFYVILLVWSADQFDSICLHTIMGRRHWVRFFYLYHFAFYIYNYKFNGQYSKLALFTSWLFILHSMVYFYHHYEIPAIQNQMLLITRRAPANARANSQDPPNNSREGPEENNVENVAEADNATVQPGVPTSVAEDNEQPREVPRTNAAPDSNAASRCCFRMFCASSSSYVGLIFLLFLATTLVSLIYSNISWSNQNTEITPMLM